VHKLSQNFCNSLAQQDYTRLEDSFGKLERENRELCTQLDQSRELVEQLRRVSGFGLVELSQEVLFIFCKR